MSRHRAVKNLDLDDELDDGGFDYSEDYYEDMTSEQQAQMVTAVQQVEQILGPSNESGVSSKEIRDSLWDSYFDVEGTVAYFLDVVHKRELKKQRELGKPSPPFPPTLNGNNPNEGTDGIGGAEQGLERLSINHPPSISTPLPSKLSSKIAASKLAKSSSSSSSPGTSASSSSSASSTPALAKKPLSKLQQKMLAKQQASASSSTPRVGSSSSLSPEQPLPRPPSSSSAAPEMARDSTPPPTTTTLPPIFPTCSLESRQDYPLSAAPSSFATSLLPTPPSAPSGSGAERQSRGAGVELARHLARSVVVTVAGGSGSNSVTGGGGRDAWGLSPDDRVLEARKGTALNAAVKAVHGRR